MVSFSDDAEWSLFDHVHMQDELCAYPELWTIVNRDLEPIVDTLTAYLKRHP